MSFLAQPLLIYARKPMPPLPCKIDVSHVARECYFIARPAVRQSDHALHAEAQPDRSDIQRQSGHHRYVDGVL